MCRWRPCHRNLRPPLFGLYTGLTPEEMDQRVTSYNEYAISTPLRAFFRVRETEDDLFVTDRTGGNGSLP